jgi:hypothetical protein
MMLLSQLLLTLPSVLLVKFLSRLEVGSMDKPGTLQALLLFLLIVNAGVEEPLLLEVLLILL